MHHSVLKAALVGTFVANVDAFWRMPCMARSGVARIDPLISPGSPSEHAHVIHGSSGFSETSTTPDLLAGECTSCEVSQDKSAYWTPSLYFQDASTGEYELVTQVGGMLAYYLLYPNAGNQTLSGFPTGFQMIAGNTDQRTFDYPVPDIDKSDWTGVYATQPFLEQAALGFNCLNYAATPEGSLYRHFLPDKAYLDANCLDGVRFELMFPSCWNGVDIDSPDHKSHVAYPSEVMTGNCPEGFETRLVSLFYETIWNTYEFVGKDGQFVLSNGDTTGYGYHGDFIMGWEEDFLQSAVDQCTNPSGLVSDCALFDLQDSSVYGNCNFTMPENLVGDDVVGPMASLPGNNPVGGSSSGGAVSTPVSAPVSTSAAVPTLSYTPGSSVSSGQTYTPGAIFFQSSATAAASSTTTLVPVASPSATSAASVVTAPPVNPGLASETSVVSYYSTEYSTSSGVVAEILWVEDVVTVTVQATSTVFINEKRHENHLGRHRRARY